ncbi:SDR family NAD(P)-dependent oxidoreductase [Nocardiopsis metallicus]|uniref:NAD(P)-dependent dehydrogenase (Short-subunit alcohol dehydrogenase family) n=1 Tax=Nocardiopsis metallicus TaxID=179819 RepID=A0A840WAQ1_9ACTN|nr:SDR family NAD(P)-dependent oxidoreductase [Nocardiopsis metallicus]MBB5494079.1 NAD(P)-dependent dehydrogenase (short-subunit alcohol dehydrogenase family) [Nocardiopsis metallicus]
MDAQNSPVALVTGATSGIGLAVARGLGRLNHRIHICARDAEGVADTVKGLRAEGFEADGTVCDVSNPEQVEALVSATATMALDRYGHLFPGHLDEVAKTRDAARSRVLAA